MKERMGYAKSIEWCKGNLKRYLDPKRYTLIYERLHSEKRSQQMTRVETELLRLMLQGFRPERSEREQKAYAESNAVKIVEIADAINCDVSTVNRAKARLNDLAEKSTQATGTPLILFHDKGVCIQATFWDAIRAREYSTTMAESVSKSHDGNIALADENRHRIKVRDELLAKFQALTPAEQAALLAGTGATVGA